MITDDPNEKMINGHGTLSNLANVISPRVRIDPIVTISRRHHLHGRHHLRRRHVNVRVRTYCSSLRHRERRTRRRSVRVFAALRLHHHTTATADMSASQCNTTPMYIHAHNDEKGSTSGLLQGYHLSLSYFNFTS